LGDIAELYGELIPVPEDNIGFQCEIQTDAITVKVYETPGHATHHLSYEMGDMLFTGEALGISYPMDEDVYLRIASPPGFDLRGYRASIGMLKNINTKVLCYGHYGVSFKIEPIMDLALAQLDTWSEIIGKYSTTDSPLFEEKVLDALLAYDPGLSCFHRLPVDIRKRELYFLGNSIKGFKIALDKV
jgi:glyoxylase-like metal-dependent hydrolase (beta-lactamase superfamily II)